MVDCKSCGLRFRADQVPKECKPEDLTEPRQFNLMFKTNVGPIDDGSSFAYLRLKQLNRYSQTLKTS